MSKPYESDLTIFLKNLKKLDPGIESRQRYGRSILWDNSTDKSLKKDFDSIRVSQNPYVYQND